MTSRWLQAQSPAQHTIIEAHPDVIAHAKKLGWGAMPGVRLCEGRWQEVVPRLIQEGTKFDGIFFDTVGAACACSQQPCRNSVGIPLWHRWI